MTRADILLFRLNKEITADEHLLPNNFACCSDCGRPDWPKPRGQQPLFPQPGQARSIRASSRRNFSRLATFCRAWKHGPRQSPDALNHKTKRFANRTTKTPTIWTTQAILRKPSTKAIFIRFKTKK